MVYDGVGEATSCKSRQPEAARDDGMFGQASGPVKPFDPLLLMTKGALFSRVQHSQLLFADESSALQRRAGWILSKKLNC